MAALAIALIDASTYKGQVYVKLPSFLFDFSIFLITLWCFVADRSVYHGEEPYPPISPRESWEVEKVELTEALEKSQKRVAELEDYLQSVVMTLNRLNEAKRQKDLRIADLENKIRRARQALQAPW